MATGLVYDDRFLEHDTGQGHPERAARLRAVMRGLRRSELVERCVPIAAEPVSLDLLRRVHDAGYIERVRRAGEAGQSHIDSGDSAICPMSYEIALLAAGGAVAAARAVMEGRVENAFCVLRPPGHHAERDMSMGFCLFGNVAVAAQYLLDAHGLQRVAIVDFDVHHGNGTQHLFEDRAEVLFISLHEHPLRLYPGTGFEHETGCGAGAGFTLNVPLQPGSGDEEYEQAFAKQVMPALDRYQPQFILISAGFDAAENDPLAHMLLSPEGFRSMTRQLRAAAKKHCAGRLVSCLEGGYDLNNLAACAAAHVEALLERA